jgi:hypothetical protein
MLQRLVYTAILALFLLQIVGYLPVFKLQQWDIRRKMELMIKENVLNETVHRIIISNDNKTQLHWERADKEFWFEGNLYDIIRSEIRDGATIYYCLSDVKETNLTSKYAETLKKHVNAPNTEGSPSTDEWQKILKIYVPITPNYWDNYVAIGATKRLKMPLAYRHFYASFYFNLIDPPPKSLA